MFEQLTYRHKNLLLIVLAVFLSIACYKRALRPTLNKASKCEQLENQLGKVQGAEDRLRYLQLELNQLNTLVGSSSDTIVVQHALFTLVNSFCDQKRLKIKRIPEQHGFYKEGYYIMTHVFEVEGGYKSLVKLAQLLETEFKYGNLSSVHYYSKKDLKTKQTHLYAKYYVQNIEKSS